MIDKINVKIGKKYPLDGILTLSENSENTPVVIFVHGSGQSDYDETIQSCKPFKDIALGLAEHGISSLRYNKRYYQYPDKVPVNFTIEDEVLDDVFSAIDWVKENNMFNKSSVYILGHSLGGMLAPYISKMNSNVSGIISLAGSPRNLEDILLDQNKRSLNNLKDKTEQEKQEILNKEVVPFVNMVKNLKKDDSLIYLFGVPSSYWLSLNKINTAEIVKKLNIPMLFLHGEKDFQAYADVDFKMWKDILSDNKNVVFKLYNNLNHLFMESSGKTDLTEYIEERHVDIAVINDICQWIINS